MGGPEILIVRAEDTESRGARDYAFAQSPVRVGRSARNDISLSYPFASAWHGLIEFDAGTVRYTDLGSTNGSRLGDAKLDPQRPVPVPPGCAVVIGRYRLTFPSHSSNGSVSSPSPSTTVGSTRTPSPADRPEAGSITALMKRLARAPAEDVERSWKQVLFPGATIGRFELVRELGRGGFGIVYEARDRQLGRTVAFKAVRPGRNSMVLYRQQRLQKEAEAVASLAHPNIVSLFDVGSCEGGPYLIFELLKGETLFERMARGRLPLAEALEIAIQVAWALDHAHAAGVVHRDLKPSNVFLCAAGQSKVLDFGIADVLGAPVAATTGTPAYMAPEQWLGRPQDARTDVFSAAAMLFESLSGRLPYEATRDGTAALAKDARPALGGTAMPPPLRRLLERALDPEPTRRPAGGKAWLSGLLEVQESLDSVREVAAPTGERKQPWRPAIWIVAVAVVLVALGAYLRFL